MDRCTGHSDLTKIMLKMALNTKESISHVVYKQIYILSRDFVSVEFAFLYIYRGYLVFLVKDRNLFHRVDTIGNIFMSGCATRENITHGVNEMK